MDPEDLFVIFDSLSWNLFKKIKTVAIVTSEMMNYIDLLLEFPNNNQINNN